jgi:uncharacterized protein DUF3253
VLAARVRPVQAGRTRAVGGSAGSRSAQHGSAVRWAPVVHAGADNDWMTESAGGELTADGRYFVVGGRRWRASDPAIPESLRQQLVAELMAARRDVRSDPETARPRVQDAKVALGERGEPWWDPTPEGQRLRLAAAMRALLRHRSTEATICPSDAARVVGGTSWSDLMDLARDVAQGLADDEVVVVRQHGMDVDLTTAVGPVRIARGRRWEYG